MKIRKDKSDITASSQVFLGRPFLFFMFSPTSSRASPTSSFSFFTRGQHTIGASSPSCLLAPDPGTFCAPCERSAHPCHFSHFDSIQFLIIIRFRIPRIHSLILFFLVHLTFDVKIGAASERFRILEVTASSCT